MPTTTPTTNNNNNNTNKQQQQQQTPTTTPRTRTIIMTEPKLLALPGFAFPQVDFFTPTATTG
jgi:hypothetical protein